MSLIVSPCSSRIIGRVATPPTEYNSDPYFTDENDWLLANATVASGSARNTSSSDGLLSNLPLIDPSVGITYRLNVEVETCANGASIEIVYGGVQGETITTIGTHPIDILAVSTGGLIINMTDLTLADDVVLRSVMIGVL